MINPKYLLSILLVLFNSGSVIGGEVAWLKYVEPDAVPYFYCGNQSEFEFPMQSGVLINDSGEIIIVHYRVWVDEVSNDLCLITSFPMTQLHGLHVLDRNAVPTRTLQGDGRAYTIQTDLRAMDIGHDLSMFCVPMTGVGVGGNRIEHAIDPSSNQVEPLVYLDRDLKPIASIESYLGTELEGNQVVGLIGVDKGHPVFRDTPTRRIGYGQMGRHWMYDDDGSRLYVSTHLSRTRFIRVGHDLGLNHRPKLARLFDTELWEVLDPAIESVFAAPGWEYVVTYRGGDQLEVHDQRMNLLGSIRVKGKPGFVTDHGVLVCQVGERKEASYRAYRISEDEDQFRVSKVGDWSLVMPIHRDFMEPVSRMKVRDLDGHEYILNGDLKQIDDKIIRVFGNGNRLIRIDDNLYEVHGPDGDLVSQIDVRKQLGLDQ